MLTLEIDLLTGVYRAALPDGSAAEWPPHPERVFSALVQAWGDGGGDPSERAALEWLEKQSPPLIEADSIDSYSERDLPIVYVPPNDAHGDEIVVLPEQRRRQARRFRVVVPANPSIRLSWPDALPSTEQRAALNALAHRLASVGHSASLVRCLFSESAPLSLERIWRPAVDGDISLRVPHEGRFENLSGWLTANERPRSGASARYRLPGQVVAPPSESVFGGPNNWFVFEEIGGFRPDILGFAQVAKRVR